MGGGEDAVYSSMTSVAPAKVDEARRASFVNGLAISFVGDKAAGVAFLDFAICQYMSAHYFGCTHLVFEVIYDTSQRSWCCPDQSGGSRLWCTGYSLLRNVT